MKTRLILFSRRSSQVAGEAPRVVFARWGQTLELELPSQMGVEDFAKGLSLIRHSTFDYAAGEQGRKATLMEVPEGTVLEKLTLSDGRELSLQWDTFPATARALRDGGDRRYLQLAVQFLAAGESVDDSVIAADYDAEFIQQLQKTLADKSQN